MKTKCIMIQGTMSDAGKSVICALGQRSRSKVVDELRDTAPFVRVIGDAARVSTITNAVYWGYHAALDI